MPHDTNPADELLHLEEKQFTVGLTEEEEARLAALSAPGPAEGGFDVAAAAAGVLAEVAPAGGPWTATDYGWDPDDANAVAWAAYYSELGWDPATVQAHLAAEAAAAGEAEPADPAAEPLDPAAPDASADPEALTAPFDAAPEDDLAAALDAAPPLDAAAPAAPEPLDAGSAAALDPWDVAAAEAAPWSPAEAPEANDSAPAPLVEIAALPPLDVAEPEPDTEAASPAASPAPAWDAPAPAASYAPEGDEVPAPIAAAGGTQVWDLSAVQAALAGAHPATGEASAAPVELLPTIDDGADAPATGEVPDFRHDVPPGWPGEPADAALQGDFELAGAGSFDPASTAALPGMDAVPPPLPELAPEAAGAAAAHAVEAAPADDFEIDLESDDDLPPGPAAAIADLTPDEAPLAPLEAELAPVEAELSPAEDPDRLAALDLSAPFLGEPEAGPEAPVGDPAPGAVDWAAAHAVPAGDPAVDLATFDAEPDAVPEEDAFAPLPEHAPAAAPLDDAFAAPEDDVLPAGADATRLWALGDPPPAPRPSSSPLPALEDEPDPVAAAPEPAAVPLASAADFLAAAAAAGPADALAGAEAPPEPEILEVGDDDVLEVVPDDAEPEPAVELVAEAAPTPAPALGLEALFGTDALNESPAFPAGAPAAVLVPPPPPPAAPAAAARAPSAEPAPLPTAPTPSIEEPAPGEPDPWDLAPAPPPAAAPASPSPAFVPGVHRVVLHTAEGQVKRGVLTDVALDAPEVLLAPQTGGEPEALPAERIRAIFFMLPTGEAPPQPEGKRVRVTFRDGRQVAGFSPDYHPERVGFFMIPADTRTHTARIWVYRASVRQVSVT